MHEAGRLRHRVQLQKRIETREASGGFNPTRTKDDGFSTAATRWASVEPFQVRERYQSSQYQGEVSHRIVVRDAAGIGNGDRVKWGSRVFAVKGVRDIEERGLKFEILVLERSGQNLD